MTDDLRGSMPVYTAKDVLVKLDHRQEDMAKAIGNIGTSLDILASQKLNERVTSLERDGSLNAQHAVRLAERHEVVLQQLAGAQTAIKALVGASLVSLIASVVAIAKAAGLF